MSFSERLRMARREKGFSQETLAEMLDVSRQTITKWERGNAFPEVRKLIDLAVTLDKGLDWLLHDEKSDAGEKPGTYKSTDEQYRAGIHDRKSLNDAREAEFIRKVVLALDGCELAEDMENETFSGKKTITFHAGSAYREIRGIDQMTGKCINIFKEMDVQSIKELFAWMNDDTIED